MVEGEQVLIQHAKDDVGIPVIATTLKQSLPMMVRVIFCTGDSGFVHSYAVGHRSHRARRCQFSDNSCLKSSLNSVPACLKMLSFKAPLNIFDCFASFALMGV